MQKTAKEKQTKAERSKGNRSYSERVIAKWFCCAFKLGFLQSICKASLIFKSNLELVLLTILKQRELYESKHVVEECRCLKIWDLLPFYILFYIFSNYFMKSNEFHDHITWHSSRHSVIMGHSNTRSYRSFSVRNNAASSWNFLQSKLNRCHLWIT